MKTKILHLLSLLLVSTVALSQDAMFKVLASKGSNKVVASNSAEQKNILIGQKLLSTDKIIVGENGYLGLAHKNGKTIELKKAGTYEVAKLNSEVAAQNANVAKKYVDFVAGEMAAQDEDMAKNRHKYMAVTGSVERGTTEKINPVIPKDASCLADRILLKWHPYEENNSTTTGYVVTLMTLAEEPVLKVETTDDFVMVDLSKYNIFKEEKNIMWKVTAKLKSKKGDKITEVSHKEPFILKYINEKDTPALESEVAEMNNALKDETALNNIVMAVFYEGKGLLLEALACYEKAIKLEPEVEDFKLAYGQFLERTQWVSKEKKK